MVRGNCGMSLAPTSAAHPGHAPRTPAHETLHLLRGEGVPFPIVNHALDDRDVTMAPHHPAAVVGSDATGLAPDRPGAAPSPQLRHVPARPGPVRARGALTWEEAIAKMTQRPAERLGLSDRGVLAPGKAADVVVFHPATVPDAATFDDPQRFSLGIPHGW